MKQAQRLKAVRYDIRGPVLRRATELEDAGHKIIKLNIGNPAPWGLATPTPIVADMVHNLNAAQGYSDARGIYSARVAVAQKYQLQGVTEVQPEDVMLGNGVSELIVMSLQALLDNGDEVLVPAPDYPLWTGAVTLCGGRAVHYRCDESNGWQPDLEHLASRITANTRAMVIINPNNPTGAVYSREVLEGMLNLARRHGLLVFADEIYDKIIYDEAVHHTAAAIAPDVPMISMGGLSKTHRAAGFRSGWLAITGFGLQDTDYLEGLQLLANMRLCPNVPAQHAIQTALGGYQSIEPLVRPGGRLYDQREHAWRSLTAIPGVECFRPDGALYLFARLNPEIHKIRDDERLIIDLLESKHLLLSHGSGFNIDTSDHVRFVFLAPVDVLDEAIGRFSDFLSTYRQ
ncbi:pyridoxal phosphate-dependent aminotransferase [Actinoplanes derwentensis]|uniref:alanine transaminase n=1 Tax=Actinoplanes derwentensis TaxID=113562 RepID=A0A1H1RCL9_9ACTN|nr:pyridoxal phosphate-dependent aminotransferase [Actinoplanes derwentensis]GID89438.1 aminotransferase [Actinoplanes derwentensis]SDS33425.1 alanine-synthesizing transaminase [Actinoplanes derwentensis]